MAEREDLGTLGLFEGYGVEIEYMIVDVASLDPVPACDWLLTEAAGELTDEWENGAIAWNNELAMHVMELKTNGPASSLAGVASDFQENVDRANELLSVRGLRLLPGAMHPWLEPARDVRLWPYGQREIYEAFDRIFDCRGHGWGNLQSMQLNLPFRGDREFAALHAAVRMVLPLLPGIAASSPVVDGLLTERADNRLRVYRGNCARVPSVTGSVVPEPVADMEQYRERILERIYRDLAPLDPEGVLRQEWVNARGAIARFDRMAIEVRVIDSQECPAADLAIADLASGVIRALVEETWAPLAKIAAWPQADLVRLLALTEERAEPLEIVDSRYLGCFGYQGSSQTVSHLWGRLAEDLSARGWLLPASEGPLECYLRHGTLATRIRRALPPEPGREELRDVYGRLADCLAAGYGFTP
ncbi:MAG: glutamate--cysteine ligase [Gammaproteobacteria bacterium]|jgi:gamma-glutamyl:cysteine ligase YbdK (ATP-grasp superfamily)|nr:glutamate--cysteine ligase [Gammaproteobacteria bacterium]